MEQFKKEVLFTPAFDKRNPDPNKNYGIHGVGIRMLLHREKGCVQFVIYTSWQLPHVQKEMDAKPVGSGSTRYLLHKPMAADVGYHSPKPIFEGQTLQSENCPHLDGPCYYDGSGLHAEEMFEVLLREGSDGVWTKLEAYYNEIFD